MQVAFPENPGTSVRLNVPRQKPWVGSSKFVQAKVPSVFTENGLEVSATSVIVKVVPATSGTSMTFF